MSLAASAATPIVLFAGMLAISSRNVKKHQFRMLSGAVFHVIGLGSFWCIGRVQNPLYTGGFPGAYNLLFRMQVVLGVASLVLGAVTLWAVMEHVWELHRRTGMFTFFSASVCSMLTLMMIAMIYSA